MDENYTLAMIRTLSKNPVFRDESESDLVTLAENLGLDDVTEVLVANKNSVVWQEPEMGIEHELRRSVHGAVYEERSADVYRSLSIEIW